MTFCIADYEGYHVSDRIHDTYAAAGRELDEFIKKYESEEGFNARIYQVLAIRGGSNGNNEEESD